MRFKAVVEKFMYLVIYVLLFSGVGNLYFHFIFLF